MVIIIYKEMAFPRSELKISFSFICKKLGLFCSFAQAAGTHHIKSGQILENRDVWSPYSMTNLYSNKFT